MGDGEGVPVELENDLWEKEGVERLTSVRVTHDLAELFSYAKQWSAQKKGETHHLTFSSMLAAMMASEKPLCRWLQRHLGLRGTSREEVTHGWTFPAAELEPPLKTTISFRTALAAAKKLRATDSEHVDVRHFVAAYAVCPRYHLGDFLRLRIDRRAWCLELAEHLRAVYPTEAKRWQAYAALAPAVPLLAFSTDAPVGTDLLHLDREVEAFSRLVAARSTVTPLSIGVFGAWGSGKSFFMRRVRERVAELAKHSREHEAKLPGEARANNGSLFHGQIAQIEFNAWHYSEGALVACLVDHIFQNLRIDLEDEDDAALRRRGSDLVLKLRAAEQDLAGRETALATAEKHARDAKQKLDEVERQIPNDLAAKQLEIDRARADVAAMARELESAEHARQAAIDSAVANARGRATLELLRKGVSHPAFSEAGKAVAELVDEAQALRAKWLSIFIGAGVIAAGLLVTELVGTTFFSHAVSAATALATVAAAGLAWVRKLGAIAKRGEEFQALEADIAQKAIKAAEEAHAPVIKQLEARKNERQQRTTALEGELAALKKQPDRANVALAELEAKRAVAATEYAAAQAEVARRRAAIDELSTGTLLREFLEDRARTDGYRKDLTIFSQVRNDFERLSKLMTRATDEYYSGKKPAPTVSRIVLYIDDLDRCPEAKVIEVLRVVHLLLAFPLFVCVVAVDPRWVTTCVEKAPGLSGANVKKDDPGGAPGLGEPAEPADYLEKIFQIPLWLRPVPREQRPELVRALLDPTLRAARTPAPVASLQDEARETNADLAALADTMRPEQRNDAFIDFGAGATPSSGADEAIHQVELDYLEKLGSILSGNPRALKRFVNTYRLVKLALSDVEMEVFRARARFHGDNPKGARYLPYRMCMAQLAVLCTKRDRAAKMVQAADAMPPEAMYREWLGTLGKADAELAACFEAMIEKDAAETGVEPGDVPLQSFKIWLERTRRYSFYI